MNNSTVKVSEIFKAAGEAFNRLGELTIQLQNRTDSSSTYSKWGEEDIDLLQSAITNFSEDLNTLSVRIKNRTATQIRQTLTKQVFEEAGIRVQQVNVPQSPSSSTSHIANAGNSATTNVKVANQQATTAAASNHGTPILQQSSSSPTQSTSEVMMTLNRLNADLDEDHLNPDLEFEVEETEVATG